VREDSGAAGPTFIEGGEGESAGRERVGGGSINALMAVTVVERKWGERGEERATVTGSREARGWRVGRGVWSGSAGHQARHRGGSARTGAPPREEEEGVRVARVPGTKRGQGGLCA
jgi:hypothetical protein